MQKIKDVEYKSQKLEAHIMYIHMYTTDNQTHMH